MDVGGTTTDIGLVEKGVVRSHRRGRIEGIDVSPLSMSSASASAAAP